LFIATSERDFSDGSGRFNYWGASNSAPKPTKFTYKSDNKLQYRLEGKDIQKQPSSTENQQLMPSSKTKKNNQPLKKFQIIKFTNMPV